MHIHFVQHEIFEAPGAYLKWAEDRQYKVTTSKVYLGELLPEDLSAIDFLIIMGGPQSPATTQQECLHFDAAGEKALINKAIAAGKAVVGVCLGSQLIGEALGASFQHSPEKEIGIFPIMLTEEGQKDDAISHLGVNPFVGHWHNDMPGLTPSCKILATSEACPRQIISYAELVYGFQCHMELTTEVAELLIAEEIEFLTNNTIHRFVQKPEEIISCDFSQMNELLYQFLDKLTQRYLSGK